MILYTYDMGDSWEHEIEFVRVIDAHDKESPYLLEASGQAPPEDVGGVSWLFCFSGDHVRSRSPGARRNKRVGALLVTGTRGMGSPPESD